MLIGGLRALLVQALNPPTMAAVAEHSNYKEDPWRRLMRTTDYVVTTIYGDTAAAEAAVARVRAVHKRIRGIDPVTGRAYDASDPDLLLWVHAAEVDSFLECYRRYAGGLSDEDADRYVGEMAAVAELIGVRSQDVPRSVAELSNYMDAQELFASDAAKDAMRFVLFPPVPLPGGRIPDIPGGRLLVIPGRAGYSMYSIATLAILPKRVRKAYRLPPVPLTPPLRMAVLGLAHGMRRFLPPPPIVQDALQRQRELEGAA
jgi:uncharacterized protein (DUF2236 family)